MTIRTSVAATLAAFAAFTCAGAYAADAAAPAPGQRHGPSPQAVAACNGKAEGSAISRVGRSGKQRAGTCKTVNGAMAAHVDHAAHGASAPAK